MIATATATLTLTGVIRRWFDHKGYGWLVRDDGQGELFIHAHSFDLPTQQLINRDSSRIVVGRRVGFRRIGLDPKGRPRAEAAVLL